MCSVVIGPTIACCSRRGRARRSRPPSTRRWPGRSSVLEELVQKFERRIAISALAASSSAIAVAQVLLGDGPIFKLPPLQSAPGAAGPFFFILGAAAGLLGVFYNSGLLATVSAAGASAVPPILRAGLVGAAIGVAGWLAPGLVGGGEGLTQGALSGSSDLFALPAVFLLQFWLGAGSYAAGTPGGLFAPMLALGAQFGLLYGVVCGLLFPGLELQPQGFAVVGMTALFTGVVRAPLTGIVLVTEMTGSVTMLLPMLAACFTAMLVPTILRCAPIYDSLRERLLKDG